jgi:hypothetical protein
MKKIFLTLVITTAAYCTNAQNTFPATGNAGIGTTTPTTALDVNGNSVIIRAYDPGTNVNRNGIFQGQTYTNSAQFGSIANNVNGPFNAVDGTYVMNRTSGYGIHFTVNNGGTESKAMSILSNGNIGIGTAAPLNQFVVNAGENTKSIEIGGGNFNGSSSTHYFPGMSFYSTADGIRRASASSEIVFSDRPGTLNFAINSRASDILFYTSHSYDAPSNLYGVYPDLTMVLQSTQAGGNVGIGTASPTAKLNVVSAPGAVSVAINTPGNLISESQYLSVNSRSFFGYDGVRQALYLGDTGPTGTSANKPIVFDANNIERMRILTNGNIGIGTINPDAKLAVKGTIHASSVLVDTNVPTPDYVFKNDYNLPSLAEIKTYTEKNHHLPGVPSAAEMEKNGLNLGEMNMTLLKKVEELTLYLIEQHKQLADQRQVSKSLQDQVNRLMRKRKK